MKNSIQSVFLAFVVLMVSLSGCAPASTPVPPTSTPSPLPPTFTPAPTATRIPPAPTATATLPPAPTASGAFGFADVSLKQLSADQVAVSFTYQLQQGLDSTGLQIGAEGWSEGASCNTMPFTVRWTPINVPASAAGFVNFDGGATIQMLTPAKCSFKGIRMMLFRQKAGPSNGLLYDQTFNIPFTLERK